MLIATDCLSEGVNLQALFTAVVHYDLTWNPTRHEQREGRVDRFGQTAPSVRALMLYGENNPVDGAVLRVILRKAERIRKELGISVPLPADTNKVMQTIMETVLLKTGGIARNAQQLTLDLQPLNAVEASLDPDWQSAKEKARATRTLFAQRRLRPEDVLPEWRKTADILGGPADVERFVATICERLGAPLHADRGAFRLATDHLPGALKERLAAAGIDRPVSSGVRPARRRADDPRPPRPSAGPDAGRLRCREGARRRRRDCRAIGRAVRRHGGDAHRAGVVTAAQSDRDPTHRCRGAAPSPRRRVRRRAAQARRRPRTARRRRLPAPARCRRRQEHGAGAAHADGRTRAC